MQRISKRDANRAAHRSAQQAVAQNIESMVPGRRPRLLSLQSVRAAPADEGHFVGTAPLWWKARNA